MYKWHNEIYHYLKIGRVVLYVDSIHLYIIKTEANHLKYFFSNEEIKPYDYYSYSEMDGWVVYVDIEWGKETNEVCLVDKLSNFEYLGVKGDDFPEEGEAVPTKWIARINQNCKYRDAFKIGDNEEVIPFNGSWLNLDWARTQEGDINLILGSIFYGIEAKYPDNEDFTNAIAKAKKLVDSLNITDIANSVKVLVNERVRERGGRGSFAGEMSGSVDIESVYDYWDDYLETIFPHIREGLYSWDEHFVSYNIGLSKRTKRIPDCPPVKEDVVEWKKRAEQLDSEFKIKAIEALPKYNKECHIGTLVEKEISRKYQGYYSDQKCLLELRNKVNSIWSYYDLDWFTKELKQYPERYKELIKTYNHQQ